MTDPMTPTVEQAAGVIAPCPFCGAHLEKVESLSIRRADYMMHPDVEPPCPAQRIVVWSNDTEAWNRRAVLAPAVGREGWRFDMENAPTGGEQFIGLDNYGAQVWLGEVYHLALSPAATPSMPSVEARAVWAWKPLGPLPTPPEGTPDER